MAKLAYLETKRPTSEAATRARAVAERIIIKGGQLMNVPPADSQLTFRSRESLRQIIIEEVEKELSQDNA